jgi:hypothetical protein
MKCDRCREQLPVVDGIEHFGQTLCLDCAMRGCNPGPEQSNQVSEDASFDDIKFLPASLSITGGGK